MNDFNGHKIQIGNKVRHLAHTTNNCPSAGFPGVWEVDGFPSSTCVKLKGYQGIGVFLADYVEVIDITINTSAQAELPLPK